MVLFKKALSKTALLALCLFLLTPAASNELKEVAPNPAEVYAAQATAITRSPTSHVKGKVFQRFTSVWFENTDFETTAADPNFQWLAKKGITLTNYLGVTHPSEPNYIAAVGGDYFGLDADPFTALPPNVSSVVDLLEDKAITWGLYQEDMPYSGFEGFEWRNQETGADAYVRKHNPEVIFDSVANNPDRLALIKNTTMFQADLEANTLPQWIFVTPNMTSDAHDSDITTAGQWLRDFMEPLLEDENFMNNTLVLITFDENETYAEQNRVLSILVGDAVPEHLEGTTDSTYYDHYSQISTVEANWDLHTLGRYDVGANVFSYVAEQTGDTIRKWDEDTLRNRYFNYSYPGILSEREYAPQPVPNTELVVNNRTVLPAIKEYWSGKDNGTKYQGALEIPDGYNY